MSVDSERFFVLTGGPGAGKTTLIAALAEAGLSTMPEAGRNGVDGRGDEEAGGRSGGFCCQVPPNPA